MTVHLVRHASAGHRNGSDPRDSERPLDDKGRRQAAAVAEHLGGAGVARILSSPYPRCVQTVEPLAEAVGCEVEEHKHLAEGSDVEKSWALLERLAHKCADDHTAVVLCSHGDVIPDLVRRAQRRGMVLDGPSGYAKGSVWTLTGWDGETFARGDWDKLRD